MPTPTGSWFTDYTLAPIWVTGETKYFEYYNDSTSVSGVSYITHRYKRLVTAVTYRRSSMIYTAAQACATAVALTGPTPQTERQNDSGAYAVTYTVETRPPNWMLVF